MFGRDPITPVAQLLEPRPRYYSERGSTLKMDTLMRLYTIVVQNICKAREKIPKKKDEAHTFKVNHMVLVKDPDAAVFEPRYQPNFTVRAIFGNNGIEVQDEHRHKSIRRSAAVKYIEPSEKVIQQLLSEQVVKNYGRSLKLLLATKDIPDLQFDAAEAKNSLESAAGEGPEQANEQRSMEKMMDPEMHNRISEYRELSQKSWSSEKATGEETSTKFVHPTLNKDTHPGHSKNREHSQNSRKK